jgi:transaldolase
MSTTRSYFDRLVAETPTRVWVNNPTLEEIDLALGQGAVGCTTNPGHAGGLLGRAREEVIPVIDACLAFSADDRIVADQVQAHLVADIATRFRPLFDATAGRWGYVSIQGSPERDSNAEWIWEEARAGHALAPNVAPKLPATEPGLEALGRVVEQGWPVIVTEVFSLEQLVSVCEVYLAASRLAGTRPPLFISPITGILGDHLKKVAKRQGLDVPARAMELAGIGLARRCAALIDERAYPATLLFGGARIAEDLTGLVGGPHCATINWSTFAEVLAADPPVENTIGQPIQPDVEHLLLETFPDVWKGWEVHRLEPGEYEGFGPVQHFRDSFLAGWRRLLEAIGDQRVAAGPRPVAAAGPATLGGPAAPELG